MTVIAVLAFNAVIIGGCIYVAFLIGHSQAWFLLAMALFASVAVQLCK